MKAIDLPNSNGALQKQILEAQTKEKGQEKYCEKSRRRIGEK